MTKTYSYTKTAQRLADVQVSVGRYRDPVVVEDEDRDCTYVRLTTRAGNTIVISTYRRNKEELMMFTAYLSWKKEAEQVGECRIDSAPTLLAGLSQYY